MAIFQYDVKNHSAYVNCVSKQDYYSCMVDRHYSTKNELADNPEYAAYQKCFQAAISLYGVVPEDVYKELMHHANAYKNSALEWQAPINEIQWQIEDGTALKNMLGTTCKVVYDNIDEILYVCTTQITYRVHIKSLVMEPGFIKAVTLHGQDLILTFAE